MGVRVTAVAALALVVACKGPSAIPESTTSLRMSGAPASASVYIDDQLVGQLDFLGAHGVALPPGVHRITVQAPGYLPLDKQVEARAPETVGAASPPIRIDVRLVAVPD